MNDSLIGIIVASFSFCFISNAPVIKNIYPEGWSYNPSSRKHRIPVIFLALTCCFLSHYLAIYQLGYISVVWDPIFGDSTMKVLTSDAELGSLTYLLEALFAWHGTIDRWKSKPWIVILFSILALPVGVVSIVLIILQPLIVKAWCFICLLIAFLMLTIIVVSIGEPIATLQCMKKQKIRGQSIWKFLIYGIQEKL